MTDDPLKRHLAAAWDADARRYDDAPRHGIRHDDERVAWRRLVAAILGDPAHAEVPVLRVLDLGTGTGVLALLAAELGHEVTALDLSEAMLAEARAKAAAAGLAVEWRVGDAERLPADLGDFDAVVCRHLAWTLPDPPGALRRWATALRPGGLVAVIDGVHPRHRPPRSWIVDGAGAVARGQARRAGGHGHDYPPEVYRRLPLGHQRDTQAIEAYMRDAGLERIRVRALPEVDRVERAHLSLIGRLGDRWQRYLATGRSPRGAEPT